MARLRDSVAQVLNAVGANLNVPHSISREFGLDKSMTSKLARVVRETDPYAAALDVPGPEAMRIFSRAMRDAGAAPTELTSLQDAVDEFQDMVRTHCGDRATLDMLLANSSAGDSRKQQRQLESFRKDMFRGASAVFGVQARVHVSSHYIVPNKQNPEMVDLAIVGGLVDFKRIRSDVTWAVAAMRVFSHPGSRGDLEGTVPLEPPPPRLGDVPLLTEFCSAPPPSLHTISFGSDLRKFVISEGPVGVSHAVTLYTGWKHPQICSRWRASEDDDSEHFVSISTPAELVIHDLFIHRDLTYARNPSVFLYNQLPGAVAYPNGPRESGQLQLAGRIEDLQGCPPRVATPDVPDYSKLVASVTGRMGYDLNEFYGVRTQVRYPPIPSMLLYRYPMPAKR